MNPSTAEYYPSKQYYFRQPANDYTQFLSSHLNTDYQIHNAQSILHEWEISPTLSTLIQNWSNRTTPKSTKPPFFSFLLYNISSLSVHLEDLIQYICSSYPTMWALTGLHFNNAVNYRLASFFKSQYTIYYQPGTNRFGGVCLAISHQVPHQLISRFNQIENLIALDIFNQNKRYTIAVFYLPPSEHLPTHTLHELYKQNSNLILVGDFNARHPQWHDVVMNSNGCRLNDWLNSTPNLKVFNAPQRTSARSQGVIDLIIAPVHLSSENTEIDQTMQITDHYPVHWKITSFSVNHNNFYEVKHIDWNIISCILKLKQTFFFNLAQYMINNPVNFILLYEQFLVALQERCTQYHMINKYRPSLPQYLIAIIQYRRQILYLYRLNKLNDHRILLNYLNRYIHYELRAIKKAQWQEFCFHLEPKNTTCFWRHTKTLFNNRKPRIQGFVNNMNNSILTETNAMIHHAFEFYSTAFKEIDTPLQSPEVIQFKKLLSEKLNELPSKPFFFKISDFIQSIRRLKTKTSSGPEKVSNKLLKSIPDSHYGFLLQIFNQLLVDNTYPEHWKLSKMILLPKEKSTIIPIDKTRPISLLPCLSKVYERCFLIYLLQWMNNNGILPPEQSGFRQQHSTTTRFVQFLQDVTAGLLQHTATLVVYVDFTKAFDNIWHDGLIFKLYKMNCPRELVEFIIQYLKNRQCYIELNGRISDILNIEKGVPQGSCLGPILFLLFHCTLAQELTSATHTHLYADDLAIIITASPWWCRHEFEENMQYLAQRTLDQLQLYADTWKQPINPRKTEWQWIHRRVVLPSITLTINQHPINRTSLVKYLGIYVDDKLSFYQHCHKMLQKIHKNSTILKYLNHSRTSSLKTRIIVRNAFILPYFQLLYIIWPLLSISIIKRIEATNRQIYRLIYNWWDARNVEVQWLPTFQPAATRAQTFLRRFIDKVTTVSPELFEHYILTKSMPMYLRMHMHENRFIAGLPCGRPNKYIQHWVTSNTNQHFKCYLDHLIDFLSTEPILHY
jgi:hypothetical protein